MTKVNYKNEELTFTDLNQAIPVLKDRITSKKEVPISIEDNGKIVANGFAVASFILFYKA